MLVFAEERRTTKWVVSSVVEHRLHTAGVGGSKPSPPTTSNDPADASWWGFLFWEHLQRDEFTCAQLRIKSLEITL